MRKTCWTTGVIIETGREGERKRIWVGRLECSWGVRRSAGRNWEPTIELWTYTSSLYLPKVFTLQIAQNFEYESFLLISQSLRGREGNRRLLWVYVQLHTCVCVGIRNRAFSFHFLFIHSHLLLSLSIPSFLPWCLNFYSMDFESNGIYKKKCKVWLFLLTPKNHSLSLSLSLFHFIQSLSSTIMLFHPWRWLCYHTDSQREVDMLWANRPRYYGILLLVFLKMKKSTVAEFLCIVLGAWNFPHFSYLLSSFPYLLTRPCFFQLLSYYWS